MHGPVRDLRGELVVGAVERDRRAGSRTVTSVRRAAQVVRQSAARARSRSCPGSAAGRAAPPPRPRSGRARTSFRGRSRTPQRTRVGTASPCRPGPRTTIRSTQPLELLGARRDAGRAQTSSSLKSGAISRMRQGRDSCAVFGSLIRTFPYVAYRASQARLRLSIRCRIDMRGGQGPDPPRRMGRRGAPRARRRRARTPCGSRRWPPRLGVSKGGFYWHFKDRRALLEEMLDTWEKTRDRGRDRAHRERAGRPAREGAAALRSRARRPTSR